MTDIVNALSDDEIAEALKIATELIDAGIPVFAAAPNSMKPGEYHLPKHWQETRPNHAAIQQWRPGWALAAVGGHAADFLDEDPRNGGTLSMKELSLQGQVPRYFGQAVTPSGGFHYLISATGERKATGFMPGLDLQSGAKDGQGRGFVYISPTVRPSKAPETLGRLLPYRWVHQPDVELLADFAGSDSSAEGIIARIYSKRAGAEAPARANPLNDPFMTTSQAARASLGRTFTDEQAREFLTPVLVRLAEAPIGEIEERCNTAASALSHFVPSHFSADEAMALLQRQLDHTAYDPTHPASSWEVGKFRPVVDSSRPLVNDAWRAVRIEPAPELAPAIPEERGELSRTDWLEAQIKTADELADMPAPVPLVYGMLDMNTEAWIIGAPGSFKSFVALDIAAYVANGQPWHGHRVRQVKVLYLAAEGAAGMTLRTRAWRKVHGSTAVDFLPLPVQVSKADDWRALVEVAGRRGYGMIVIDTQARVSKGLDENTAQDAGVYIDAVTALRQATGACVLTVHHTGRKGGDARGSSAIDGAQDSELKLERIAPRSSMKVRIKDDKQKDMAENGEGEELQLQVVDLGIDPETERPLSSLVVASDPFLLAGQAHPDMPEEWETGHGPVQIQVIKVLRDQGRSIGLTKAEARDTMVERFYGRDAKRLSPSTFRTAWSRVLEMRAADDEQVAMNVTGEKWIINEDALSTLPAGQWSGTRH